MYDSYISKYPLLYGILIIYEDKMIYLYNCIQKTYANGTIGIDRRRRFDILKNFVIKKWRYILTAFIALMIGVAMGPSDDSFNKLENDNNQLNKQLEKLQTENADLAAKVEQAAPWFEMKAAEQEKIAAESKAKEEAEAKAKASYPKYPTMPMLTPSPGEMGHGLNIFPLIPHEKMSKLQLPHREI